MLEWRVKKATWNIEMLSWRRSSTLQKITFLASAYLLFITVTVNNEKVIGTG